MKRTINQLTNKHVPFAVMGLAVPLAAACQTGDSGLPSESVVALTQPLSSSVNLVTQDNCSLRYGRYLVSCSIPTQVLTGQELETAVPLRTVLTVHKSGNCSTQFPLEVALETPNEPVVRFSFLSQQSAVVRRRDGLPIPYVTLKDSSKWTGKASFDRSCYITADIVSNAPDVDSKEQAQAILDRLTVDVAAKTRIRDRYADLLSYQKAFDFLSSVVEYFHTELTNDQMQQLRDDGQAARATLMKMVTTEACGGHLRDDELVAIVALYESLAVLGSSDSWQGADGATKTIAEFLEDDGPAVLSAARILSEQRNSDGTGYELEYESAALDVERAKAKLALARAQLAPWLE